MSTHSEPLVSVGLTSYRRAEGLTKILNCVLEQTYKNLDIIVSDNCSSMAEVEEVLTSFSSLDSRIRVFRQQTNIGMEPNHTFVARQATGEYFLWLHDDDDIPNNYIESCVARFSDSPDIELVGSRGDRYLRDRYWYSYNTYSNIGTGVFERLRKLIPIAYFGPSWFEQYFYGVFRRDSLNECIWQDTKFYYKETFSLFFRLSERGFLHVADDVTLKKYNVQEDIVKWRDANYIDRPLRYKFAGSNAEQFIPRTLNIFATVIKSKRLSLREKFSLLKLCLSHFLVALSASRDPLHKRIANFPRRLFRKTKHVIRRALQGLLRIL